MPFPLGRIVATPGALAALASSKQEVRPFLARHTQHDWGDVPPEDAEANDRALKDGTRIISSYRTTFDEKIWVITEADRSSTCVLLPEEY